MRGTKDGGGFFEFVAGLLGVYLQADVSGVPIGENKTL
jgi:hypothetical protein